MMLIDSVEDPIALEGWDLQLAPDVLWQNLVQLHFDAVVEVSRKRLRAFVCRA